MTYVEDGKMDSNHFQRIAAWFARLEELALQYLGEVHLEGLAALGSLVNLCKLYVRNVHTILDDGRIGQLADC